MQNVAVPDDADLYCAQTCNVSPHIRGLCQGRKHLHRATRKYPGALALKPPLHAGLPCAGLRPEKLVVEVDRRCFVEVTVRGFVSRSLGQKGQHHRSAMIRQTVLAVARLTMREDSGSH